MYMTKESVDNLLEDFWLTADLIDYLIKHRINPLSQQDIIIPTSAIENLLSLYY